MLCDQDEIDRLTRSLGDLDASSAASKLSSDRTLQDLTAQLKRSVEESTKLRKQVSELSVISAENESQARKTTDECERLQHVLTELGVAKATADANVMQLTSVSKTEKGEVERLGRQLIDAESRVRKAEDTVERLTQQLTDVTNALATAKAQSAKETIVSKAQQQKDADMIEMMQRQLVEGESRGRKQVDEIAQLTSMVDKLTVTKASLDAALVDLTTQSQQTKDALDKRVEELASRCKKDGDELVSVKRQLADVTALRGEEKITTDEKITTLEAQIKAEKDLVETARVQGLDRDLRIRKDTDDRERLQKQLDEALAATSAAEALREEVTPLG